jgi:indolepyruvate ferredoxin oxidoreductase
MVAAGADALSLYAKDRTVAFGNADLTPTADFVTDRDVRFDEAGIARRIAAATRSYAETPAHHQAETELGDAIYSNMIMLGFAWQHGLIPVSSRALYRAIRLNGVDAEPNLQAFEMGRRAAHDPSTAGPRDDAGPTPETMALDDLIAHRERELTAYQNPAYARRYRGWVDRIAQAEAIFGSTALTRAVATNLYKLMAYKDEYEVARLYTDGRFAALRDETFRGGKAKVWLAPPILSPKGPDGRPRKIAFDGWMLDLAFPMLARLKGLRGTPLDLFGATAERRMERGLIAAYEAGLETLLAGLTAQRLPLAVQIAQVPQSIRGFGHIKDASVATAKAEEAKLWAAWEAAPSTGASDDSPVPQSAPIG